MRELSVTPAAEHAVSAEYIRLARAEAARSGRRLVDVLEERIGLDADAFVQALAATFHYQTLSVDALRALTPDFELLSYPEAVEHACLFLRDAKGRLLIVFSDPFDLALHAWAEERVGEPLSWLLMSQSDLTAYLTRYEESLRAMDSLLPEGEHQKGGKGAVEDLSIKSISEDTSPVVKLVHSTIYDAFKAGASDIHLETGPTGLTIKCRIDGVLARVGGGEGLELAEQVISRIKVMSELDIAERRIPQDGRFKLAVRGRAVDFRVSVMPSIYGEDAVVRILDKQMLSDQRSGLRLDCMGFDDEAITMMRRLAREPYGMLLVTGPTGSGKTTTLYAVISEINTGHDKIVTIEDPVEYQLPGVLQIPVNEKKGLTFSRGLRSILRHDPDKIMVGEIRDSETAQIAVQSALTGHLVLATVHTNNVLDVFGRFIHMGVDPYNFVSALNGVMAQRLVRVICSSCGEPDSPDAKLLSDSHLNQEQAAEFKFRLGRGCDQCHGSGYRGRKAIAEILHLNDDLRERIVSREPIRRLKEAARAAGMRFLREAALDLVRKGETTLQEINRVTFVA